MKGENDTNNNTLGGRGGGLHDDIRCYHRNLKKTDRKKQQQPFKDQVIAVFLIER
jgi:hypothetical protein